MDTEIRVFHGIGSILSRKAPSTWTAPLACLRTNATAAFTIAGSSVSKLASIRSSSECLDQFEEPTMARGPATTVEGSPNPGRSDAALSGFER